MQVVCPQCHAVCVVPDVQVAAEGTELHCEECGASLGNALTTSGSSLPSEVTWLALLPAGQTGPYDAQQMAELFDQGSLDWGSLVWRQGLKGWRPARRDPQLVTATAAARGASSWGDTQRVGTRRSLLPAGDTVVEPAPPMPGAYPPPPAGLDWEENGAAPTQPTVRTQDPTLADAFRSAPSILGGEQRADAAAVTQRPSSPSSWLPSPQSMLMVAVVAFASGVVVAALWGRIGPRAAQRASTVIVRSTPPLVPPSRPVELAEVAPPPPPVAITSVMPVPSHDQPRDLELRREAKRISPDVRRCVDNLARGADLEIYFEGSTGRVRDVKLRTQRLAPGRVECIVQAARQMQVAPFRDAQFKYWHKFAY